MCKKNEIICCKFAVLLVLAFCILSCVGNNGKRSVENDCDSIVIDELTLSDVDISDSCVSHELDNAGMTITVKSYPYLKYKDFPADSFCVEGSRKELETKFNIVLPRTTHPEWLRDSIVSSIVGDIYIKHKELRYNNKALLTSYMKSIMQDDIYWAEEPEQNTNQYQVISAPICVARQYVTYETSVYMYFGGAHGMGGVYGSTFFTSDGSRFDWNMIEKSDSIGLCKLIWNGLLAQYFNGDKNEMNNLYVDETELPLPEVDPYLDNKGVVFMYSEYEIGPFCYRHPTCTISYESMKPYLSNKAKALLK